MTEKEDDGINRDGLEFRAGWLESIQAIMEIMQLRSVRLSKGEEKGFTKAYEILQEQRRKMIDKMKGKV